MKRSAALLILTPWLCSGAAEVKHEAVPEGGVQPQVAVEPGGTAHLVYLKEKGDRADIRYTRRAPGAAAWDPPLTVNSVPQSAVATGTIRGAQLALGKSGRVHVVWNGAATGNDHAAAPLLYTRMAEDGKSFTAQRNLLGDTRHLDGGASIAATEEGGVFVIWHAAPTLESKEADRLIYVCRSTDEGTTFTPAKPAAGAPPGVCPCCSLKAFTAPDGSLLTLYRNTASPQERDMTLLTSRDRGQTWTTRMIHPWPIAACPMSSATLAAGSRTPPRAAWESDATIYTAPLTADAKPIAVSDGKARHPAMAVNAKGETLIAWSIGTGWKRGGEFGWLVLDASGKPTATPGTAPGVPVWSHTATFALPSGDFVVLH